MTRHSRNATANPCYTYAERKKDSKESGWGSKTARLSKDAVKPADCCSLTLQPAKEPVVTTEGYLFDRSAIIEYMVQQKEAIALKIKQWKARKAELESMGKRKEEEEKRAQAERFAASERHVVSASTAVNSKVRVGAPANSNANSFWVPGEAKTAEANLDSLPPKPDETVKCPMTGKPLKLKDLFSVHFKLARKECAGEAVASSKSLVQCLENGDYVCALTGDVLTNSQQLAVLRPSGAVVLQSAADQVLKFDAKHSDQPVMDPIANKPLEGIISLKRGGTGFTSAVDGDITQIQATVKGPALAIS